MISNIDKLTESGCNSAKSDKVCRSRGGESCAFDGAMIVLQPIADAAHVVHPLAGQGLNLGLQDVDALLRAVGEREAFRSVGDGVVLRRYERARAEAVTLMRVTTDGLARLFAIDDPLVRGARNAGMALVNRLKPLKSRLIRQALG